MIIRDLTGKQFSYLTVLCLDGKDLWKYNMWKCICICGTIRRIRSSSLVNGSTKSCGCKISEIQKDNPRGTTHGQAVIKGGLRTSTTYAAYTNAEQRCNNPKQTSYKDYGGRGIKFLFTSFEQFFAELGTKPKGLMLDRIDNDGNYEPGNVRWVTAKESRRNQRPREVKDEPKSVPSVA